MARLWLAACLLLSISVQAELMGGLEVASPENTEVIEAARIAVNLYNRQSNDMYMYSMTKVISAETQLVSGIIYYLDVEAGRCMKHESPDLESCPERDTGETFACHFELLEVPWEKQNQLIKAQCRSLAQKMSESALLGGITQLSPNTPDVQQLAHFAVDQYTVDSQEKYTYSVIQVLSAQEQVVEGLQYDLEVLMGECATAEAVVCTANSITKTFLCNFTIWQQPGQPAEPQVLKSTCSPSESQQEWSKEESL